MEPSVVQYELDDETVVRFEIDPLPGFRPAGVQEIAGRVKEAVAPAVEAARVVLDRVQQARPDQVKLKFGIKVSGTTNWLVAKAASEGNFEIEMTWNPSPTPSPPAEPGAAKP
ncbi:hypothetical protein DMA12_23505 [Amycolatopsis balhimycina DSM 5908]|uniref:Trypsin-co-occurring domain-containing protein n=1 Tax=Amycolatopsis balhimycina DSM 5908 TaxID=1081091 RepID=A0A428WEY4_AMYBA|nr:CU044_2847 family protein [Amycolatopsis balhimycina]RSM41593.1 hypothetical protein DMA12_23505 [Amycolatopsis balhimycina DSM 5908]